MRIQELTGYKNNPIMQQAKAVVGDVDKYDDSFYDEGESGFDKFFNYISQHGFKRLGYGTFANVYEKPGYPWVFKLFKDDEPYVWFFKYCKANQNNPHVPRIRGNLIKISDDTFCIRMEKLTPMPENSELYAAIRRTLLQLEDDVFTGVRDPRGWRPGEKEQKLRIEAREFIRHSYPKLFKVLHDLASHGTQWELDLHEANVMMRGNVPVITDPITETSLGY